MHIYNYIYIYIILYIYLCFLVITVFHRFPKNLGQEIGSPIPGSSGPGVRTSGVGKLFGKSGIDRQMGVSENSVPLNPMVNDHYPY